MIRSFNGKTPRIADSVYVDQLSLIIGDVEIGERSSVWPGAVIRSDHGLTKIGERTSIQDSVVLHGGEMEIGDDVTIGHGAVIECEKIGNNVLIGANATILDGAIIGEFCLIAAGSVVRQGAEIPPHSFVAGVPGEVRELKPHLMKIIIDSGEMYDGLGQVYKDQYG